MFKKKMLYAILTLMFFISSWASALELQLNFATPRSFPHSGSYTEGYLEDTTGRIIEQKTINHGASWVDSRIVIPFSRGGWAYGYYNAPGGWVYTHNQKKLLCTIWDADCSRLGGTTATAYDSINTPRDTQINFLKMGRPLTNTEAYVIYSGSNGLAASMPVITNSSGSAVFLPPASMIVTGGVDLGDGQIRFDPDQAFYTQGTAQVVVREEGRPAPTYLEYVDAGNGINVGIWVEWENLATIPGHKNYEIEIYDGNTGNLLNSAMITDPEAGFYGVPGGYYVFGINAYDTQNRLYASSGYYSVQVPNISLVRSMSAPNSEVTGIKGVASKFGVFNVKPNSANANSIATISQATSFAPKSLRQRNASKATVGTLPLSAATAPGLIEVE